jgi:DNA-binding Xre family transcriptional regulator
MAIQWNLRMVAAQRGIWRASELRKLLTDAGLPMSHKKALRLWSGPAPISIRLDNLETICRVLSCEPNELLIVDREPRPSLIDLKSAEAMAPVSSLPAPAVPQRVG